MSEAGKFEHDSGVSKKSVSIFRNRRKFMAVDLAPCPPQPTSRKRLGTAWLLILVLLLSSGCSSGLYLDIQMDGTPEQKRDSAKWYAGNITRLNCHVLHEVGNDPADYLLPPRLDRSLNAVILSIDLPFSLVFDVATFPWQWWRHEHLLPSRLRDPNFGGVWEFQLPVNVQISEYDSKDGVTISIGNAPKIVFYAGQSQPGQSIEAAIRAEEKRYLGVFKTPIATLERKENCEYGKWRGIYLRLYVPARKSYLDTYILGSGTEWIFLGRASQDERSRFDIVDFVSNLRFIGYQNAGMPPLKNGGNCDPNRTWPRQEKRIETQWM